MGMSAMKMRILIIKKLGLPNQDCEFDGIKTLCSHFGPGKKSHQLGMAATHWGMVTESVGESSVKLVVFASEPTKTKTSHVNSWWMRQLVMKSLSLSQKVLLAIQVEETA
jgi:hypothetical protein